MKLVICLLLVAGTAAAETPSGYRVPDQVVVDLVDAPVTPAVSVGPGGARVLLLELPAVPTIVNISAPELRLGGIRINPANNGPSKPRYYTSIELLDPADGTRRDVRGLPKDARIRNVAWSPDGTHVAFTHDESDRVTLWMLDVERRQARRLGRAAVTDAYPGNPLAWAGDSRRLFVRVVPERGAAPARDPVPAGPVIQENLGRKAPARAYQDLLEDAHDEALFDHYFTAEIVAYGVNGGRSRIAGPGIYTDFSVSPDGAWLLTERIERPYSYMVPAYRFPLTTEVHRSTGGVFHVVERRPLAIEVPIAFDATVEGKRSIHWRSDAPATLAWVEAADGGDPSVEAEVRDRMYTQAAPFRDDPVELAALGYRYSGVRWGDGGFALVYDRWYNTRRLRTWQVNPDAPEPARLLVDRSYEDRYNDPGRPVTVENAAGFRVLLRDAQGRLTLFGDGASPDGDRPFVDRWNPMTGATERLWRSEAPFYEEPVAPLDATATVILTRREALDQPPNYQRRNFASGHRVALTDFPHPTPALVGVEKRQIGYERDDGLPLSGTLYLPAGYDKDRDGRLPLIVWAYPREYVSLDAAGQITDSPYRFTRLSYWRPQFLVTQGYAVLDDATMPIVGVDGAEPNDSFVAQLVANGEAAVKAVAELGVADPSRAAIGGHSYGAFMTANMLAHSDAFRAGVARSGAYNRSLTPFGFQREQRTIWDDTDLYITMSPFFHAHKIDEPLLMIHGMDDNNSGTFPMQSERLYHAIRGLGGTARLVILPNESHGYRARESLLHMLWETITWLDTYVKPVEQ